MSSVSPLRDRVGKIKSVDGLRTAGAILAQHLGLPRPPLITVGYVPWQGPSTPIIEYMGAGVGAFTVARWAVRGKYRRSWESLEYALVIGIGMWLESHRKDPVFADKGTSEALLAWYGKDVGGRLAADWERRSRSLKRILIVVGAALLVYVMLWAVGIAR